MASLMGCHFFMPSLSGLEKRDQFKFPFELFNRYSSSLVPQEKVPSPFDIKEIHYFGTLDSIRIYSIIPPLCVFIL